MFKKIIFVFLVIICISSGAFAILSNEIFETPNVGNINSTGETNLLTQDKDKQSFELSNIDYVNDYWQYTYGYLENVGGELRHIINHNGAYYLESEGLSDRYIQCIECGGWIPIGPITNPLPKAAICHYYDGASEDKFSEYSQFSVSRDEAYAQWVYKHMPVYDDFHIHPERYVEDSYYHVIYCNDCGGHVFLKNYNDSKFWDYNLPKIFNNAIFATKNLSDIKLCSHYNGSLDVFNTPAEDFYPGWFRSVEEYNAWLHGFSLKNNTTEKVYVPWGEHEDPVKINPVNLSEDYSSEADIILSDEKSPDYLDNIDVVPPIEDFI